MTLKVRILQFCQSNNFDQNCSKKFSHCYDQWSISFSLKSVYQIPLSWSPADVKYLSQEYNLYLIQLEPVGTIKVHELRPCK